MLAPLITNLPPGIKLNYFSLFFGRILDFVFVRFIRIRVGPHGPLRPGQPAGRGVGNVHFGDEVRLQSII